jgi:hypothetical protein
MALYAILDAATITANGTARSLWPHISFSSAGPDPAWLAEQGAEVIRSDPPHDPATHYLSPVEPYLLDGVVYDRVPVERPPVPPKARWQGFQVGLLTDPLVHDMMMAVKDNYPGLISAWSTGLGQAAVSQGFETFLTTWGLAQALPHPSGQGALLPPSLVAHVATLATSYDLPAEFVEGLNPQPPESGTVYPEGWDPPDSPARYDPYTAPDGSEWVYDQPRNADGTYVSDDPETEVIESALDWQPALTTV